MLVFISRVVFLLISWMIGGLVISNGISGSHFLMASPAVSDPFLEYLRKSPIAKEKDCLQNSQTEAACLYGLRFLNDSSLLNYRDWESVLKGISNHCTQRYNREEGHKISQDMDLQTDGEKDARGKDNLASTSQTMYRMANICLSFVAAFIPELNCSSEFKNNTNGATLKSICEKSEIIAIKVATEINVAQPDFDVSESFVSDLLKKMRTECESSTVGFLPRWLCVKNAHRFLRNNNQKTNFYSARKMKSEICGAPLKYTPVQNKSCVDRTSDKIKMAEGQDRMELENSRAQIYELARREYHNKLFVSEPKKSDQSLPYRSQKSEIPTLFNHPVDFFLMKLKILKKKYKNPLISISYPRLRKALNISFLKNNSQNDVDPQFPPDQFKTVVMASGYEFVFDIQNYCSASESDECEQTLPPIRAIKNINKSSQSISFAKDKDRETLNICSVVISDNKGWKCLLPKDKQIQWNQYYETLAQETEKFVNQISSEAINKEKETEGQKLQATNERFRLKLPEITDKLLLDFEGDESSQNKSGFKLPQVPSPFLFTDKNGRLSQSALFSLRRALKSMPMGMVVPYNPNDDFPMEDLTIIRKSRYLHQPITREKYVQQVTNVWTKIRNGKKLTETEEFYLLKTLIKINIKNLRFSQLLLKEQQLLEEEQKREKMQKEFLDLQQNPPLESESDQSESSASSPNEFVGQEGGPPSIPSSPANLNSKEDEK